MLSLISEDEDSDVENHAAASSSSLSGQPAPDDMTDADGNGMPAMSVSRHSRKRKATTPLSSSRDTDAASVTSLSSTEDGEISSVSALRRSSAVSLSDDENNDAAVNDMDVDLVSPSPAPAAAAAASSTLRLHSSTAPVTPSPSSHSSASKPSSSSSKYKRRAVPRYFGSEPDLSVRCFNCGSGGHVSADCEEERQHPPCFVCGQSMKTHVKGRGCPNELCWRCGGINHQRSVRHTDTQTDCTAAAAGGRSVDDSEFEIRRGKRPHWLRLRLLISTHC